MSPASAALHRRPAAPSRPPGRRLHPHRTVVGAAVLLLVAACVVVPRLLAPDRPTTVCAQDALQERALLDLQQFASWLREYRVAGFVGEVGWPGGPSVSDADSARWNALAEQWFTAADRMRLPVAAWAAGPWPGSYPLAVDRAAPGSRTLTVAGPQAAVLARHTGPLRGVSAADGSFGTSTADFSATDPGAYGSAYGYEGDADDAFLAAQGVTLLRLSVSWERLQPVPMGPLAPAEVARLRDAVSAAQNHGLHVLLDLHGYGAFRVAPGRTLLLGSAQLPAGALADLWSRLVPALPPMYGYDLLNEPSRLAVKGQAAQLLWQAASQQAVDAIRRAGGTGVVVVGRYARMGPGDWGTAQPRPWIVDPRGRVAYDAHAYFDSDGSGRYASSYTGELTLAQHSARQIPGCLGLNLFAPSSAVDRTLP